MSEIFIPKWQGGNGSAYMKGLERHIRHHVDLEKHEASKRAQEANMDARMMASANADGLGQLQLVVPASEWHRCNAQYPGCSDDKQFVREFMRDNPEMRGQGVKA